MNVNVPSYFDRPSFKKRNKTKRHHVTVQYVTANPLNNAYDYRGRKGPRNEY